VSAISLHLATRAKNTLGFLESLRPSKLPCPFAITISAFSHKSINSGLKRLSIAPGNLIPFLTTVAILSNPRSIRSS